MLSALPVLPALVPAAWVAAAAVLPAVASPAAASSRPELHWRPLPEPAGEVLALAYEPGPGRLAVADRSRVWLGAAADRLVPVHRSRDVRDLAFGPDGALWIASGEGLQRIGPDGGLETRTPGIGARARDVRRIRLAGERWIAATAAGVRVRDPAGGWAPLAGLPAGEATALAVAPAEGLAGAAALRLGAVVEGVAHWWVWVARESGSASPTRIGSGTEGARSSAVDVWISPESGEAITLLRDGCVVGERRHCAPLPAGAEARRIFRVGRRWWLASDRGLLVADSAFGPWRRTAAPLGGLRAHAVAGEEGAWFVATDRGLLVGRLAGHPAALGAAASDLPVDLLREWGEPGIEDVRIAVLTYLDLGPSRLQSLRRGAARRGWLPTLSLRLDHDRSAKRSDDFDQAFLSGGVRSLSDRQDDRSRGFDASLALQWDLGDVLYHPESVDVSREVRELVELRDDVLDEVRQLFFERRRVLLELLALPAGQPLEAARLRLRVDELTAGIDAWTGGWYGRRVLELSR